MDRESDEVAVVRHRVKRRARALRIFYWHAMVYCAAAVALLLVAIMDREGVGSTLWWAWPVVAWGVVVGLHGLSADGGISVFGPRWEDRKIDELMRRRHPK
jgi:amino acid transporter